MSYWIFVLPILSAVLSCAIVMLASRLLTHKIIPARQAQLASTLGLAVSRQFSLAPLEQKITDPANVKSIMPVVETHIDDFLRNKLKEKMPMIGMLIGDKTIQSLKEVFLKEIEEMFPRVLAGFAGNLRGQFDLHSMIAQRVQAISPTQISNAIAPLSKFYTLVALIAGFVIGIINVLFFHFFLA